MKRNLTGPYALIVAFYWIGFAILTAFASMFLLDVGFSNTVIGVLLAMAGIGSSVAQPLVSTWAEKPNSPSLKRITIALSLAAAGLSALTGLCAPLGKVLCALTYGCALMLMQTLQPMVNAVGMESLNRGERLHFGVSRASGSVGYAAISYGMGFLAARFTPRVIPVCAVVCFCALALVTALYPQPKAASPAWVRAGGSLGVIGFFRKYRRFGMVLVGCTLVVTSHNILNFFNLQIVLAKGGGSVEMGTATALAACIEIPGMILFAALSKRFRLDTLLVTSGVFFLLKSVGSLLAPDITVYYAVQLCQLLGWGLFAVVSVSYTNRVMQPEDAIKGQGYCTVVQSFSSVLSTTIGGRLLDVAGVDTLLIVGVCVAALGVAVIALSVERVRA